MSNRAHLFIVQCFHYGTGTLLKIADLKRKLNFVQKINPSITFILQVFTSFRALFQSSI